MAVTEQPQEFGMFGVSGSQGLDVLTSLDQIIAKPMVELVDGSSSHLNTYHVIDAKFQNLFNCIEDSERRDRLFYGGLRGFILHIQDPSGRDVLTLEREVQCNAGCCCCADTCCLYPANVYDAQRKHLGVVRNTNSCCTQMFGVFDSTGDQLYYMDTVTCPCPLSCVPKGFDFVVYDQREKTSVATIEKKSDGFLPEVVNEGGTLQLKFAKAMSAHQKALLLASMIVMDMNLFSYPTK